MTDDNWSPSYPKQHKYTCKTCDKVNARLHREANRDEIKEYQRLYREVNKDKISAQRHLHRETNQDKVRAQQQTWTKNNPEKIKASNRLHYINNQDKLREKTRLYRKENPEKAKANDIKAARKRGVLSFDENKDCTAYFGIHINEGLIKLYFDDVEVMPYGHPDYDFVCKNGWKIDGKCSSLHKDGRWSFSIKRNATADYFFCVAYDNRTDLNPLYIWLLPGDKFNHLMCAGISPSTLSKWDKYRKPIGKAILCCDSMKGKVI